MSALRFLKSRLKERSTLVGICTAIGAASAFPAPYSWLSLLFGSLAALVPDGKVGEP